jgi:hypothetical protein
MIDLREEHTLPLTELAKLLPGRPSVSSLHRWCRGMKDGRRLECIKLGGRVYSNLAACERFAAAATKPTNEGSTTISANQQAKLAKLDRELDAEGL